MTTPDTTTPEDLIEETGATATQVVETEPAAPAATSEAKAETEAPAPDTATEAPAAEPEVAAAPAETAETETAVVETTPDAEAPVAETAPAVAATEVAAPAAAAAAAGAGEAPEEDPQTAVFSLVTFFLAALPVIGVILNAIAVARAGKEGFDLWLARWGLALAIIETVGALALVGLGYYLGLLTAGAV